nr:hypothetical protein [Tanacetum cinerariifolium]
MNHPTRNNIKGEDGGGFIAAEPRQWWLAAAVVMAVGSMVLVVDMVAAVAAGDGSGGCRDDDGDGVRWRYGGEVGRVGESDIQDRVDRKVGSIFGFAGKRPPEKFSGGGSVVAGGGYRIWGREYY